MQSECYGVPCQRPISKRMSHLHAFERVVCARSMRALDLHRKHCRGQTVVAVDGAGSCPFALVPTYLHLKWNTVKVRILSAFRQGVNILNHIGSVSRTNTRLSHHSASCHPGCSSTIPKGHMRAYSQQRKYVALSTFATPAETSVNIQCGYRTPYKTRRDLTAGVDGDRARETGSHCGTSASHASHLRCNGVHTSEIVRICLHNGPMRI